MFSFELPPSETPWRWEAKEVDVESEVRKAVLEERQRCTKILVAAIGRYRGSPAEPILSAVLSEFVLESK